MASSRLHFAVEHRLVSARLARTLPMLRTYSAAMLSDLRRQGAGTSMNSDSGGCMKRHGSSPEHFGGLTRAGVMRCKVQACRRKVVADFPAGNAVGPTPPPGPGFGRRDWHTRIGPGHKGITLRLENQPAIPRLAQHPAQGDFCVLALATATADVGMATAEPHFLDRLLGIRFGLPCARTAGPASVALVQVAIEAAPSRALEPGSLLIQCQGMPNIEDAGVVTKVEEANRADEAVRLHRIP